VPDDRGSLAPGADALDVSKAEVDRVFDAWRKRLRFAVEGPDGRFSTAWATWEKNDTVYVAGRTTGGAIKVSLHPREMGGYRLAYTKDFYAKVRDRVPQREIVTWPTPEVSEREVVLVVSICFPTAFMRSGPPPSSQKRKYLILGVSQSGRAGYVGFFLSRAGKEAIEASAPRGHMPIVGWSFDDGTSISLVAWESEFDASVLPRSGEPLKETTVISFGPIVPERTGANPTMMLFNEPGPGIPLRIIELGGASLRPYRLDTSRPVG
jgi:hypothetical protein